MQRGSQPSAPSRWLHGARPDLILLAISGCVAVVGSLLPWEGDRTLFPVAPDTTEAGLRTGWGIAALLIGVGAISVAAILATRARSWAHPAVMLALAAALYAVLHGAYSSGLANRILPGPRITAASSGVGLRLAELADAMLLCAGVLSVLLLARRNRESSSRQAT